MKKVEIYPYVMPLVYFFAGVVLVVGMVFIAIRAGVSYFLGAD
jgi:hypothetical protein